MNKKEQEFLVQKIRTQYTEREHTQLDELKKLDTKVKKPAKIFAYLFGSAGALIMGVGMSLTMTDIGSAIGIESTLTPGIVIGLAGIFMAAINYPVYKSMLNNRRKKYEMCIRDRRLPLPSPFHRYRGAILRLWRYLLRCPRRKELFR